ncbi:MAG: hydrogenase nickel incorporation protein HypB [Bacteroidales bacterium]|nr:hydrogenase nickel incorporation protein HypB [Bacteroidales bacterium]
MCDTCGCNDNNSGYTILKIQDHDHHNEDHQEHDHNHPHNHDHHHSHPHPGHEHQPEHIHQHPESRGRIIEIEKDALQKNNLMAQRNRGYFDAKNILAVNLVSSPGSGKTTILEKTILSKDLKKKVTVIEGDQQTISDATRIHATGVQVIQINTGNGCHLDALMVHSACKELNPPENSLLMIENVGNLICPAMFDLGESFRVVIVSVTEGEDKPLKYPYMFQTSDVCLINKIDLLPHLDFDLERLKSNAARINHHIEFIDLSAKTGEGFGKWTDWLESKCC